MTAHDTVSENHSNSAAHVPGVLSEREKTAQRLLAGMRLLNIAPLPEDITKKVTINYEGMKPMERFMLETLKKDDGDPAGRAAPAVPPRSSCVSCVATVGRRDRIEQEGNLNHHGRE